MLLSLCLLTISMQAADVIMTTAAGLKKTALHFAAQSNDLDGAWKILKSTETSLDVNAQTEKNWTPLHYAVGYGHIFMARMLLENGADVNAVTDDDWTPLHFAVQKSDYEMAKLLLEHGALVYHNLKGPVPSSMKMSRLLEEARLKTERAQEGETKSLFQRVAGWFNSKSK